MKQEANKQKTIKNSKYFNEINQRPNQVSESSVYDDKKKNN